MGWRDTTVAAVFLGLPFAVKELSHLPIIVDPSHGTGRWQMVRPMARAAIAAGADGLMITANALQIKYFSALFCCMLLCVFLGFL